jgi:hypothetical protein
MEASNFILASLVKVLVKNKKIIGILPGFNSLMVVKLESWFEARIYDTIPLCKRGTNLVPILKHLGYNKPIVDKVGFFC